VKAHIGILAKCTGDLAWWQIWHKFG